MSGPPTRRYERGHPRLPLWVCLLGPFALDRDDRRVADPDLRRERVRRYSATPPFTRGRTGSGKPPSRGPTSATRRPGATCGSRWPTCSGCSRAGGAVTRPTSARRRPRAEAIRRPLALRRRIRIRPLPRRGEKADGEGATSLASPGYQRALALYRGDFCEGQPDADWAALERDRLRLRYLTAVIRAGELLLADGDEHTPLKLGHEALHAEPWSEAATGCSSPPTWLAASTPRPAGP